MTLLEYRLRTLPGPARALAIAFLLALAAGFAAAQVNLRFAHAGLDGEEGLSYDDVVAAFHGRPGHALLTSKIDGGSMERYVPRPADKQVLLDWVAAGASEGAFEAPAAVLDRLCVRCHHPGGEMAQVPFAESRSEGPSFELVSATTVPDTGISYASLARSTHAHVFGMGVLFALAGLVFLGTDVAPRWKTLVVVSPYGAMVVDIGCWWLTKWEPAFAAGIMVGGAAMAAAVAVLVLRPLWELVTPARAAM